MIEEKYLRIEGNDKNGIYGKLRTANNRSLVIHVHGMTHNMDGMLEVMSADFFLDHSYDHYRMSLYSRENDSRRLSNSTISTHVSDISFIIAYFHDKYDNIFLSAHSLGALVILALNPTTIKAISFWDPSFDVMHFWSVGNFLTYMPKEKKYQLDYGNVFVISEDMVEEIKKYPDTKCLELAKSVTIPAQMIIPEVSIFSASPKTSPENYRSSFAGDFLLEYISGANHTFSNMGNQKTLLNNTVKWFDKYC